MTSWPARWFIGESYRFVDDADNLKTAETPDQTSGQIYARQRRRNRVRLIPEPPKLEWVSPNLRHLYAVPPDSLLVRALSTSWTPAPRAVGELFHSFPAFASAIGRASRNSEFSLATLIPTSDIPPASRNHERKEIPSEKARPRRQGPEAEEVGQRRFPGVRNPCHENDPARAQPKSTVIRDSSAAGRPVN